MPERQYKQWWCRLPLNPGVKWVHSGLLQRASSCSIHVQTALVLLCINHGLRPMNSISGLHGIQCGPPLHCMRHLNAAHADGSQGALRAGILKSFVGLSASIFTTLYTGLYAPYAIRYCKAVADAVVAGALPCSCPSLLLVLC